MTVELFKDLFYIDNLSWIMIILVGFVSGNVGLFAKRFLKGDSKYSLFFIRLIILASSIFVMVSANNIFLFLIMWGVSNFLLVKLMIHKAEWSAAKASGKFAFKNFVFGFFVLAAAFIILSQQTHTYKIQEIITYENHNLLLNIALGLMLFTALIQSAIWPFHRWLISSVNAPTPVSAVMHAGLINGGGFLLTRFSPLFLHNPLWLKVLFCFGLFTAILGTLWKLMQHDIKRMLACSTMGQMGFMIMQCGLGLFPAAIAHLCWHGFFKAFLFLGSSSAAQEKRLDFNAPPTLKMLFFALVCGSLGAITFSLSSRKEIFVANTNLVLSMLAMIAATQFALPLLRQKMLTRFPFVAVSTVLMGGFYGLNVYCIERFLTPYGFIAPQPLSLVHIIGIMSLFICWAIMLFRQNATQKKCWPSWILRLYVYALNASQPHPSTTTTHRNDYKYI